MKLFLLSGIAFLSALCSLAAQEKVNSINTKDNATFSQPTETSNYFLSLGLNILDNGNSNLPFNTDELSINTPFFASLERRNTSSNFAVVVSFSTNRLKIRSVDKFYFSIDAGTRYYFDDYIFNNNAIETYLGLGLGRFFLENNGNNSLNLSGGGRYWFSKDFALSIEAIGKVGLKPQNMNVLNHYAYNIGIVWKNNSKNKVLKVPGT